MANTNVVSFNDAVLQRQRSTSSANTSMGVAANDDVGKEMTIIGNKQLIGQEKLSNTFLDIKKILTNISKTLETSLAINLKGSPNTGSAIAAGTEKSEKEDEDNQKINLSRVLLQNIVSGISGLTKVTNDKLGKLGDMYKEGADKSNSKDMFDRMRGGLGNIYDKGKGFVGGIGNKLSAAKNAFTAGKQSGGIGNGLGRAFSSLRGPTGAANVPGIAARVPGIAGAAEAGLGAAEAGGAAAGGGFLSTAGRMLATPLAGAAAIGLAGFGAVNDVMGNIDKSNEVEENVKSGALTRDQGNVLQGEALGDTAGTAAGAAIGGIAGSALGPLGTAAGMWLGSKAGGFVGGVAGKYGVKAYQGVKSLLGFGETKEEAAAKLSPEQKNMQDMASGKIDMEEYNKRMKLQTEGGSATPEQVPTTANAKRMVGSKELMQPKEEVPAAVQAAISNPEITAAPAVSNIVATPTQESSGAKTTGIWDSMKSMGASALGGIKSGADWVGNKASEIGSGVSNWFGGTRIGQDLAKRNVGVGYNGVGVAGGEELVGSKENLESTDSSTGESSRKFNKGVTVEKSALGSSWLGRMIAGKGTQTESFVADSSNESVDKEGKVTSDMSSVLGQRKSGGWFGKDDYKLTDPKSGEQVSVDKSTYMKAKDIAASGGDASAIGGLIAKDQAAKEAASIGPATTAMGDQVYGASAETANAKEDASSKGKGDTSVVNAPTNINNTTQQNTPMKSPFRNEESSLNRYLNTRMGVY
jgi:hypothetical protein